MDLCDTIITLSILLHITTLFCYTAAKMPLIRKYSIELLADVHYALITKTTHINIIHLGKMVTLGEESILLHCTVYKHVA